MLNTLISAKKMFFDLFLINFKCCLTFGYPMAWELLMCPINFSAEC